MYKFVPILLLAACASQAEIVEVVTVPTSSVMCNTSEIVRTTLQNKFNEYAIAGGLASNGYVLEIFVSCDHKTWSVVLTDTKGISCLIAIGTRWRSRNELEI